ncbi:hypothetical protein CP10881SC42_0769 [Chlamydia avium]|uniref:Uncharacterized protein n=1 Tax=Chlamydia avium TaxID=1457141 RepID=A0ABN0MRZ1_9CHLA|nr:hypothetical protein CP10881SC42_0769 [Chlamydia avium]
MRSLIVRYIAGPEKVAKLPVDKGRISCGLKAIFWNLSIHHI